MANGNQHTVDSVIKGKEHDTPDKPGVKFSDSVHAVNSMKLGGWGWSPPKDALKEADNADAAAKEEKKDGKKEEKK